MNPMFAPDATPTAVRYVRNYLQRTIIMAMPTKRKPEALKIPMHLQAKYPQREVWMHKALEQFIRPHFKIGGYDVPEHVRIGAGWPSVKSQSQNGRRIGEAWSNNCSKDKSHEIIISLYLDDPLRVLGVLIHEVIHVTIGCDAGHRKPFTDCMKLVGLEGKATATGESKELLKTMEGWVEELGCYPHAKLEGLHKAKKQTTRMLKLECPECSCVVRTSQKWIGEYGNFFPCPCGDGQLVLADQE